MKYLLIIALAVCSLVLISCTGGGGGNTTNKPTNSANSAPTNTATTSVNHETDVKKLVADLAAALSKNDTAALDKIYSDDYTLVTQTGDVATKKERLDGIKSGDLKFENIAFNDVKVRSYGDSAVAIANSSGKSTNKGKVQDTGFRITFVANKTKDGWRLVSAHLSPMPAKTDDSAKKDESNKTAETNKTSDANKPANK